MTNENQKPRCQTCNGKGTMLTHMMEQLEECPSCKGSGEQPETPNGAASSEFVVRRFPIIKTHRLDDAEQLSWLPWEILQPHEAQAMRNHGGQNLEKLASRGGLSACEAVAILKDMDYYAMWGNRGLSIADKSRESNQMLADMLKPHNEKLTDAAVSDFRKHK